MSPKSSDLNKRTELRGVSGPSSETLFRLLHYDDVQHGTETIVHCDNLREAEASTFLAIISGGLLAAYPWFLRSTAVLMQLSHL